MNARLLFSCGALALGACGRPPPVPLSSAGPGASSSPPGPAVAAAPPAAEPEPSSSAAPRPVPPKVSLPPAGAAKVVISVDRPRILLGENAALDFCVKNRGSAPFEIEAGGDYRGGWRSARFKVSARGADGALAPDPHPGDFNMGGFGGRHKIAPGAAWCQTLPLFTYVRIEKPGPYTVRVAHDLGWGSENAGVAEISVMFALPDAREADRILAAALAPSKDHSCSNGEICPLGPDPGVLREPLYLPLLEAHAGVPAELDAVAEGIGSIATVEATRTLLRLAGGASAMATRAGKVLASRLPDPELQGKLGRRNPFLDGADAERAYLIRTAWRPDLAADVRALGDRLLGSSTVEEVARGGFFLQCVGDAADLPALTRAFDRTIAALSTLPLEKGMYPRPRGASMELARAAESFAARGVLPQGDPRSPGELGLWLTAFRAKADFRPAGWEAVLGRAIVHPAAYVRELTLRAVGGVDVYPAAPLPVPTPAAVVAALPGLLGDADPDVAIAALHLADRRRDGALLAPILGALAKGREQWLLRTAYNAAVAQGARVEAMRGLAGHLDDPDLTMFVIGELHWVVDGAGGWDGGTFEPDEPPLLKARWLAFIAANQAFLAQGNGLPTSDPRLRADLFPRTMRHHLKNGTTWP